MVPDPHTLNQPRLERLLQAPLTAPNPEGVWIDESCPAPPLRLLEDGDGINVKTGMRPLYAD